MEIQSKIITKQIEDEFKDTISHSIISTTLVKALIKKINPQIKELNPKNSILTICIYIFQTIVSLSKTQNY